MQVGLIIHGKKGDYILRQEIGTPGLYGQAYLCAPSDKNTVFDSNELHLVVKSLRSDAPSDAIQRLQQEAETLRAVAQAEAQVGVDYAVRLIDQSAEGQGEAFIVLERARGENFVEQILARHSPFNLGSDSERLILIIMYHFARALQCVHKAGILYLDMKLDNLFWNNHTQRLKIIDWNVVEKINFGAGIAGDWARFGARLYETYTSQYLEISPEGYVVGTGPTGARWSKLPFGIRHIITEALALRYHNDEAIIRDLEREIKLLETAQQKDLQKLLNEARAADIKSNDAIAVLSTLARAESLVEQLPSAEGQHVSNSINELKQRANERLGKTGDQQLNQAFILLKQGNYSLAQQTFERSYDSSGKTNARARRGLWLAQLGSEAPQLYSIIAKELLEAIEALALDGDPKSPDISERRLDMSEQTVKDHAMSSKILEHSSFQLLQLETQLLQAKHSNDPDRINTRLEQKQQFNRFFEKYPDLTNLYQELIEQLKTIQRNEANKQKKQDIKAKEAVARQAIEQINEYTPYHEQLERFNTLKELLKAQADKHPELQVINLRIRDLRLLSEFTNLQTLAEKSGHDFNNLKALYQQAKASPLAALVDKLVLYGEQKQQKTQQLLEESKATLNEIKSTLVTINTSSNHHHQDPYNSQNNIDLLLQQLYLITQIKQYINDGLLTKARNLINNNYIDSPGSLIIESITQECNKRKNSADLYSQELEQLLGNHNSNDISNIIKKYNDLLSTQIDEPKYYAQGKDIIRSIFESLDTDINNPLSFQSTPLFKHYSKVLASMWTNIIKIRKTLIKHDQIPDSFDELYEQLKDALTTIIELQEAQASDSTKKSSIAKKLIEKVKTINNIPPKNLINILEIVSNGR